MRRLLEERPSGVLQATSEQDRLFSPGSADHYFRSAANALRHVRLALVAARRSSVAGVLDFGCGYGRVLRMLRAEFPEARAIACDLNTDAVDFCAREFGAEPVYSNPDPAAVEIAGEVDLIWSGSFFTHIDVAGWSSFLRLMDTLLAPGGVLVFTTAGRNVIERMEGGEVASLSEESARGLIEDYERTGFGYRDYPGRSGYGLSRAKPSWICAELERIPPLRLLAIAESQVSGSRQDFVSCVKAGGADG